MRKPVRSFTAILVCAAMIALCAGLPRMVAAYDDRAKTDIQNAGLTRAARPDVLSAAGMEYETALALYIDRVYNDNENLERTWVEGSQRHLDALKQAGVAPQECTLRTGGTAGEYPDYSTIIMIEPVSDTVTSIYWSGEVWTEMDGGYWITSACTVDTELLLKNFIDYLGLSGVTDWVRIERPIDDMGVTSIGLWSLETRLYIETTQFADSGGNTGSSGIKVHSQPPEEIQALLAFQQYEEGGV